MSIDGLAAAYFIQKLNGRALFPRLKHLVWRRPFDASSLLVIFLSPMLRTVCLDLLEGGTARLSHHHLRKDPTAAEYAYGTALQIIHSHAPQVNFIQLCTSAFPCSVNNLRNYRHLLVLELCQVTNLAPVLDVCNSIPLIRKLDVQFSRRGVEEPAPDRPSEFTSVMLRVLKLDGSPQMVLAAAAAVHAPNLTKLGLTFEADEDVWTRCTALIASRFAATVRELKVTAEYVLRDAAPGPYSFHDWFAPLYACRALRRLQISTEFRTAFAITGNDVRNMARAWPRLAALSLRVDQDVPDPALSVTELESFAKKCLQLDALVFPFPHHTSLLKRLKLPVPFTKMPWIRSSCTAGAGRLTFAKRVCRTSRSCFRRRAFNIDEALGDDLKDVVVSEDDEG